MPCGDDDVEKTVAVQIRRGNTPRAEVADVDTCAIRNVDEARSAVVAIEPVVPAPRVPVEQIEVAVVIEIREHRRVRFLRELLDGVVFERQRKEPVVGDAGDESDFLEPLRTPTKVSEQQVGAVLFWIENVSDVRVQKTIAIDIGNLDAVPTKISEAHEPRLDRDVGKTNRGGRRCLRHRHGGEANDNKDDEHLS